MPLHSSVLKYVDGVARYGSIRRAARKLNISSSSINRHVLALEMEYGIKLFERVSSGVRLTDAGGILLRHIRQTLKNHEHACTNIESLKGLNSGKVTIATIASVGTYLLPMVIEKFKQSYPGISFEIVTANSVTVANLVKQDEVDVGFTFYASSRSNIREVLEIDMELGCIMAAGHPLANESDLTLAKCLHYDLILPSETISIRDIIDRLLERMGSHPRIYLEADTMAIIQEMVLHGLGISFQTKIGVEPNLRKEGLVFKILEDAELQLDRFVVLVSGSRVLSPAAQTFVAHACPILVENLA